MAKFRKKPVKPEEVEATQWFKNGDHPDVLRLYMTDEERGDYCQDCGTKMPGHGFLELSGEEGQNVCPGDWVVSYKNGQKIVFTSNAFEMEYEPIED